MVRSRRFSKKIKRSSCRWKDLNEGFRQKVSTDDQMVKLFTSGKSPPRPAPKKNLSLLSKTLPRPSPAFDLSLYVSGKTSPLPSSGKTLPRPRSKPVKPRRLSPGKTNPISSKEVLLINELSSPGLIGQANMEQIMKQSRSFSAVEKCKLVLSNEDQEALMTKRLVKEMKRNELLYWFARLLSLQESILGDLDRASRATLEYWGNLLIEKGSGVQSKKKAITKMSSITSPQIRNLLLDNNVSKSVIAKRLMCSHNMRILNIKNLKDDEDLRKVENSKLDSDLREIADDVYFSQNERFTLMRSNGDEY